MIYRFDGFELDTDLFELRSQGQRVAAQPKVLSFLFFLAEHHPKAVDRKDVIQKVWGDVVVTDAALARVVMEARKALSDTSQERLCTVRGRGFRLAVELEEPPSPPLPAPLPAQPREREDFFGRELCMAALGRSMEDAAAGRARLVVVSGPSGVGKTRVLEEAARMCGAAGALVCSVACNDATAALEPWRQMLDALIEREADPDLLRARDSLSDAPTAVRALGAFATKRPLVLLFDDIQSADDASLVLMRALVRQGAASRVLCVASLSDQATEKDGSAPSLLTLLADSGTLSIPLRSLSLEEVARLIEAASGEKPPPSLVSAVHKRSGGIPHYVHQLMETTWVEKALRDGVVALASSIDLQPGIVQSIGRRLTTLSNQSREVLTTAALLGDEISFTTLLVATSGSSAELHDRLDEATRAKLLVPRKNDTYEFSHALVSDVLRKGMSTAVRAKRHHEIAERLLAHHGASADLHARELAYHFTRSLSEGPPEQAITFSIRAAEQSALVGADEEAAKHWSNAATALRRVHGHDARHTKVLLSLARAKAKTGDREGALSACLDALLVARAFAKAEAQAEAVLLYVELGGAEDGRRASLVREALAGLSTVQSPEAEALTASLMFHR